MEWTSLNDLREMYLSFFESKGHLRHKSFPLVPMGDKSLLLINAGMAPLKKYFTGEEEPPRHRMTTCQKCIRTPDIESVGKTGRHGTFFEMLGNFSFGDYFKNEATAWAWEFCTQVVKLPEERLWVTIYEDDDEAYEIWTKKVGVNPAHIVRLGKDDNFWEIGSGPCGPCSEIYFDRGEKYGCDSPTCGIGSCDCDRYIEFWNLVFTQFDGDGEGGYTPLANPNIDTGMGLERLACIMQDVDNIFEVDTVRNIMKAIIDKAGIEYGADDQSDVSLRVITDHIRSTVFMVCDGVIPSNEGRGYVLRRLLRRAARHGRLLGIEGTFLADLVPVVAKENITEYPELTEKLEYIQKIISIEEDKFAKTIDKGMDVLDTMIEDAKQAGKDSLSGEDVFMLNDTLGFPLDLTREIAQEKGLAIDEEGFKALMNEQKARARAAREQLGDFGWSDDAFALLDSFDKTEFTGYTENSTETKILAIFDTESNEELQICSEGKVIVVLEKTPFYGEGGGQVGDTGKITKGNATLTVLDTKKTKNGVFFHICEVDGSFEKNDTVLAQIDVARRDAIRRNHSAAHLLQAALRRVLGSHVEQAGSYVDAERVRFDFTHYAAPTAQELAQVEALVNEEILKGEAIITKETSIDEARAEGAMALFGEKYGDVVRMVKMGDFSTELCGGTHLDNTAKAGLFKLISESSVASGVRRIEGTTGLGVMAVLHSKEKLISDAAEKLKCGNSADLCKKVIQLQEELKAAKRDADEYSSKLAVIKTKSIGDNSKKVGTFDVITAETEQIKLEAIRNVCDMLKTNRPDCVAVISVSCEGKHNFVAVAGKNAVANGANAGAILKQISAICGGGGGGRPDSATSGIKDPSKISEALAEVYKILEK